MGGVELKPEEKKDSTSTKSAAEAQTTKLEWDKFQDNHAELYQRLTNLNYPIEIDENGDPILSGIRIIPGNTGNEWIVIKDSLSDWDDEKEEGERRIFKLKQPKDSDAEEEGKLEGEEEYGESTEEFPNDDENEKLEKEPEILPSYIDHLLDSIREDIAEDDEKVKSKKLLHERIQKVKLSRAGVIRKPSDPKCTMKSELKVMDPHGSFDWTEICYKDKWEILAMKGRPIPETLTEKETQIRKLMISMNKFDLDDLCEQDWNMELATTTKRPITRTEVFQHAAITSEMLVVKNNQVFNLTKVFINGAKSKLSDTLLAIYKYVGADVTHWFNPVTCEPRTKIDMKTGNWALYIPDGIYYGLDSDERMLRRRQRRELKERVRRCFDDDAERYYESYATKLFRDRDLSQSISGEMDGEDDWLPLDYEEVGGENLNFTQDEFSGELTRLTKQDLDEFFGAFPSGKRAAGDDDTVMAIQGSDINPKNNAMTIESQMGEREETDESTLYTTTTLLKSKTSIYTVVADDAEFDEMWWLDSKYVVGFVPQSTFYVRVINTLNRDERILEVCKESTVNDVMRNYLIFNRNAKKYIWRDLWGNMLHPHKTLMENGMWNPSEVFEERGVDHWPVILLHYKDGFEWEPPLSLDLTRFNHPKIVTLCRNY